MRKFFKFLYLNTYSFLLLFCGILVSIIPFHLISIWLIIPQIIICLLVFKQAIQLLSSWNDKKIKYQILVGKNKNDFRPDSFKVFMQSPCGRLLAKAVLRELNQREKYKDLIVYKEPLVISLKNYCQKQEAKIYINEDFK